MMKETEYLFWCVSALLLLACVGSGCASSEAQWVNQAALAYHTSPSSLLSREMAARTLNKIREQEKDYRIGTDDVLSITVFEWLARGEEKTVEVRVSESGAITLPLLGSLRVKDKTVHEVEEEVITLFSDVFIKNPGVSVSITEFRSKIISVVGAVANPNRFTIRHNVTTLLDALSLAGGLNERAGYELYVIRPRSTGPRTRPIDPESPPPPLEVSGKEIITIDTHELIEKGNLQLNVVLSHGDVVHVPEAHLFYVVGFVRKPGGFPLKRPTTILEGIALSQGLIENEASPRHCILKRREKDGEVVVPLNLVAISDGLHPNLFLRADDIIDVRQTFWTKAWLETLGTVKSVFGISYSLNNRDPRR